MNNEEWLKCTDPQSMLVFLEGRASARKARLYACGVGRSLWPFLGDERSRTALEIAERHADRSATDIEMARGRGAAQDVSGGPASRIVSWVGDQHPWQAARMMVVSVQEAHGKRTAVDWSGWVAAQTLTLVHCVFGNPFRPCIPESGWLTDTVVNLAQIIYDERAFDRMPELADALENAGCTQADILEHCRGPGPHVRGCWVIDLLLGRT
jgi:hypothetical protein